MTKSNLSETSVLTRVSALLVCEGPTDERLAPHLRTLLVQHGADEAVVQCPEFRRLRSPPGHDVAAKVRVGLELFPETTLLFVHRDADGRSGAARRAEITEALADCVRQWVAVIPIQALEAWLLCSADAIVAACGRSGGSGSLSMPRDVEGLADPKATLRALVDAAQAGVARRRRRTFEEVRNYLLEQLDPDDLRSVPSWCALAEEIAATLRAGDLRRPASQDRSGRGRMAKDGPSRR